ncbi:MAG: ABC transporter ATP-binding protein [Chloroflexi bacterium]|nr:ABC transporter ATP-binding protein [Chloroflexota bacterium]
MTIPLAICARGLCKRFRIYHRRSVSLKQRVLASVRGHGDAYEEFLALDGLDLDVPQGQVIGILGANGSGKSTLLKILARVLEPDGGHASVRGRVSAILELGAGFQPDLSGRRNIYLYGSLLGLGRREINARLDEIIAFSELERFIDNPVRHYSSGMHVRLAYAIGAHVDADVLLLDEVLAVGDEAFRNKCLTHIDRLKASGKTIVLVSHSMGDVESLCDRAIVVSRGRVVVDDSAVLAIAAYRSGVEYAPSTPA